MTEESGRVTVSFPVTVWYAPETGKIHVLRRTDPEHQTQISPDARAPDGHAELYSALLNLLLDKKDTPLRPANGK